MSLRNALLLLASQNSANRPANPAGNDTPDTPDNPAAPPPLEALAQLQNHLDASQQLLQTITQWVAQQAQKPGP
jgi:hypothetical protein